ncbi:MAG: Wzz/FepE/Etk N-terminal domain-containing protein [Arachidicoccus sp.]|nr:Wzz/FepE/Etk N-terminal domain-containing protein [Arachidicoccus sp.]
MDIDNMEEEKIDFSKILLKIKANWLFFAISIAMALLLAFVYIKSVNPSYNTAASILIKDPGTGSGGGAMGSSPGISALQDLGIISGKSNADNELQIIKTPSLLEEVVYKLNLYLSFSMRQGLRKIPLYGEALPFELQIDSFFANNLPQDPDLLQYEINLQPAGYTLTAKTGREWKSAWGVPVSLPFGKITLFKKNLDYKDQAVVYLNVSSVSGIVDHLESSIDAEIPNKQVSIIDLTLPSTAPRQSVDILNTLIDVYQKAGVEDNNRVADSTIKFINDRLVSVTNELSNWEEKIQDFKQKNNIADITAQSQALVASAATYSQGMAAQQVQLSVVNALLKYMMENRDSFPHHTCFFRIAESFCC